jgi:hypothetical protein
VALTACVLAPLSGHTARAARSSRPRCDRAYTQHVVALRSDQIGSGICTRAVHDLTLCLMQGRDGVGQQRNGYGGLRLTLAYTNAQFLLKLPPAGADQEVESLVHG